MSLERAEKFKDQGNAKFKSGDFQGAIELYTKAIEENPNEASYYTNRCACYLQLKQFNNVIQDAKTATIKNPKFIKGYFRAAQALLMLGRTSDARRECSAGLEIEKGNKELTELVQKIDKIEKYLTAGQQHLGAGQSQEALSQFELALQLAPQSTQIALFKAEALIGLKKFEEANILAENILKEDGNNAEACLTKGKAMYYMGNESGSRLVLRALQLSPEFPAANEFRKKIRRMETLKADGNSAFEKGQYQEAFEIYQKAIDIDPLNATINASLHCNRSACAMKMKNYTLAEKEASSAIDIDPKYLKAYLRRGECLIQQQKYEEAQRDFAEAQSLDPSNSNIKQKLREVQKLVKQAKKKDYYKILEVDRNADEETIRKAYKKMAVKYHPDKFTDEEEKKKAEAQFKDIGEAYSVLSDPQKKRRFDMGVDDDEMGGGFDMGGIDPHDIFSMFMGGGMGGFGGFGGGEGVRFSSGGFPGGGRRGGGHSFFFG